MAIRIGTRVSNLIKLKLRISAEQKKVDALKSRADKMQKEIVLALEDSKTERVDVAGGSVTLKKENVCMVESWSKVQKYILKNDAFDLLKKEIIQSAYRARKDDGVRIPGTKNMIKKKLSIGRKRGSNGNLIY